jgi:cobalt/nickel transport system permease protein
MHISEGVLGAPVLAIGAACAVAGLAVGLKKMDYQRLPQTALLASAFFVASLVHVPIGPTKAHLVLNGLVGLLLGCGAFPALFVGLALQAVVFQYGGLTTLGINTLNMALPALVCHWLFARAVANGSGKTAAMAGFSAGALAVFLAALMVALTLVTAGESLTRVAWLVILANLPVMVLEGVLTAMVVGFLRKVRPALLGAGT